MKAILIDDEQLALDFLELQLKKVGDISVEKKFTFFNPIMNKELIEQIDIVFLDLEMPTIHGIDMATELLNINPDLLIIFVTAYNDFATEAFDLNVFDYLIKPIQLDRLRKTCKRLKDIEATKEKDREIKENVFLIRVGGELTFKLPDETTVRPKWRTSKVKELFLYLLHKRGKNVLKSELSELLWPDTLPEISYPRLYTLTYHMRKILSPYEKYLTIESTDGGYTLIIKNAYIDLFEWESRLESFQHLNSKNIGELEKVMELYSGSYLGKYDYIWAEAERYRLEQKYIDYALQIARYFKDTTKAIDWYIRICIIHPDHEEAIYELLNALEAIDNHSLVTYYYKQYEKAVDELQIEVKKEIKNWYSKWKKNTLN